MTDEVQPLLPVGLIKLWGAPYHGLVQSGQVTLPNTNTRDYPQPSGGDSYLIKFAGAEAPERTSSESEWDVQNGREWRNYAIVAGQLAQLHGQDIDSPWVHKDEIGRVWQIKTTAISGDTKVRLDMERLFYIARDPSETYLKMHLVVSVAATGLIDSGAITLMDVKPDGSEAAFRIDSSGDTALIRIGVSGLGDHAAGATAAAVVTVVKDAEDSYLIDDVVDYNTVTQYVASINQQTGTHTDEHGCDMPIMTTSVSSTTTFEGVHILNNHVTDNREIIDRTWHFWGFYDRAGAFKHVSVRKYHSKNNKLHYNTSGSGSITSEAVSNYPVSMSCSTSSSNIAHWNNSGSESYTTDIDQSHEGIVRMEIMINDAAISVCELIHNEQIPGETPPGLRTYTRPATTPAADPGVGDMVLDSVVPRPVFKITLDGAVLSSGDSVLFTNYPYETSATAKDFNFTPSLHHDVLPDMDLLKITNKMLAIKLSNLVSPDYTYKDHVTPDGADGVILTTQNEDEYGSYQPETGDITRNQSSQVAYV
jgi:hypothetical protein